MREYKIRLEQGDEPYFITSAESLDQARDKVERLTGTPAEEQGDAYVAGYVGPGGFSREPSNDASFPTWVPAELWL